MLRRWAMTLMFSGCMGFFAGGVRYVSNRPHYIVTGLAVAALAMGVALASTAFINVMSEEPRDLEGEHMIDERERGTHLPNARKVTLVNTDGTMLTRQTPRGVYMWPNGWLTAYLSDSVNEGTLVPPWRVFNVYFGEADESPSGAPSADEVIAAVDEVTKRTLGADIVYVHGTPSGGPRAAIVKIGTPAYEAIDNAYPELPLPPHDHIEPGMW